MNRYRFRLTFVVLLAAMTAWLGVCPAVAQDASAPGPAGPGELETFLDAFMGEQMAEKHIPGAALVLVRDGEILLNKGYGYADVENRIPVDPERTVFRWGSVGKAFTAVAVMQLAEQGRLDLHADVNQYLPDFQLPGTYAQPVTLAHLLTHTAGLDDCEIGYDTPNPAELIPLQEFLADHVPPRVRPRGEVYSYCNIGFDLAGYIVEASSGTPFAQYVEQHIFQPLGMDHTTFLRPLPASLAADRATSYAYHDGVFEPVTWRSQRSNPGPAGTVSGPAAEMAGFMIALLQGGSYQDHRILHSDSVRLVLQQNFAHHPKLPGLTYGFEEQFVGGLRLVGKLGDSMAYSSQIILYPEDKLGFFVVYNAAEPTLREDLIRAFFERYYPQPAQPAAEALSLPRDELQRFEGFYRYTRYSQTTLNKLNGLPFGFAIGANDDGTLSMSYPGLGEVARYVPVEPLVFRRVSGGPLSILGSEIDLGELLVFREDESGRIPYAFASFFRLALEKLAWYERTEVQVVVLAVMLAVFLSVVVSWPLGWFLRRWRKCSPVAPPAWRRSRWLAGAASGLNLVTLVALPLTVFSGQLFYGVPLLVTGLLVIPLVTTVLAIGMVGAAILAWKNSYGSVLGRLHYSLVTLAALTFIAWTAYWNLLGFQF
ncbi:MAG: serine hydrolase [Anaerolineae bacterium]|nr:serine hydrolase [Anaerolineae bacterium]